MPRSWLALTLAMCVWACVDRDDASDDDVVMPSEDARASIKAALADGDEHYDVCEHLPASGPCALLCDHDALVEQYVPDGACAAFLCELTDGQTVSVHACHPAT